MKGFNYLIIHVSVRIVRENEFPLNNSVQGGARNTEGGHFALGFLVELGGGSESVESRLPLRQSDDIAISSSFS